MLSSRKGEEELDNEKQVQHSLGGNNGDYRDCYVHPGPNLMGPGLARASLPPQQGTGGEIALEDFEYLADLMGKMDNPDASPAKDVYTNLAELYDKAGDKGKAERFRKLAENL